jgi:8-amino-7-oxononanoate synthase
MSAGGFALLPSAIATRRSAGLFRERRIMDSPSGPEMRVDGKTLLAFCSNDYLGLANDPRVISALQEGAARYGAGSGASHLVCGHSRVHHELEEALAAFTGRERALLFGSGYAANIGVAGALLGRGDAIFQDRLNHASLIDGGLLCGARFRRFAHSDMASLERGLARAGARRTLVAVDGVFSMDGDEAPLGELAAVSARYGAWLYVDDAHGFGVLGARGRGSLEKQGLDQQQVPLLMATLGKGLGTSGAFVAGSRDAIETLLQHARTYIYTTAMPPAIAAATLASLGIAGEEGWRRQHLEDLVRHFRAGAEALGFALSPSLTPIQPILLGDPATALDWSARLLELGILVTAIRPPTVPRGTARLRITLSAAHSAAQVDRLLDALEVVRGAVGR